MHRRCSFASTWLFVIATAAILCGSSVDAAPRGSSNWKETQNTTLTTKTTAAEVREVKDSRNHMRGHNQTGVRGRKLERTQLGAGLGGAAGKVTTKGNQKRDPISLPTPVLPIALSDHTSTEWKGLVYIAGGCDSPLGNKLVSGTTHFRCSSISDAFFYFDPSRFLDYFTTLPNMPRSRYRHSSTAIKDQVWLIGGRDANHNLVPFIDVRGILVSTSQGLSISRLF
jgi:hypothetical protein